MNRWGGFLVCVALAAVGFPTQAAAETSMEAELFSLVNGGRASSLVQHDGLEEVARAHSKQMAESGRLSHDGARERIRHAPPDPAESNGAPDDGFEGLWCENLASVAGAPDHEIAQRIYDGWLNSPSHKRCMTHGEMTAGGIAMYFDGKTWWATFELMVDSTLPGTTIAASTPAPPARESAPEPPTAPALTAPVAEPAAPPKLAPVEESTPVSATTVDRGAPATTVRAPASIPAATDAQRDETLVAPLAKSATKRGPTSPGFVVILGVTLLLVLVLFGRGVPARRRNT